MESEEEGSMLKGLDLSKWQGDVDWDSIKSAVDFVIIKASGGAPDAGQSASQYADAKFVRNRDSARSRNIPRGFYHFAYPDYNSAEAEANCFCDVVGNLQDGEILVLDYERDSSGDQVAWCKKFLDTVSARYNGYKPMIYLSKARILEADWSSVVAGNYGLWMAWWTYNTNTTWADFVWPNTAMRQYSNKENIAGINPVDANVFYGTVEQFYKYGWHDVIETPAPVIVQPDPAPVVEPVAPQIVPEPVLPADPLVIPTEVETPTTTPLSDSDKEVIVQSAVNAIANPTGVKTTEFWTPIINIAASLFTANFGGTADKNVSAIFAIIAGVTAVIYVVGRVLLKLKTKTKK